MTYRQAADVAGVTERTIKRWVRARRFRVRRLSRKTVRIEAESWNRFLEGQR